MIRSYKPRKVIIKEEIIPCKYFFKVERRIINQSLPPRAGLTLDEFKKYLLLCRRDGPGKKSVQSSVNDSRHNAGIKGTIVKEKAIIESLSEKQFIDIVDPNMSRYKVLSAPRYNHVTKEYVKGEDVLRKCDDLKETGNGYIILPYEIVDKGYLAMLSGRQILVLLKLYEYNLLHMYGGVDASVCRFRIPVFLRANKYVERYAWFDETLYEDIYISRDQFITTLRTLYKMGLFKFSEVIYKKHNGRYDYIRDYRLQDELVDDEISIYIIRPVYQWEEHIIKWGSKQRNS